MGPQSLICWCENSVTKLGDLSSVSEVGVGLFLALGIVQVIGSGGLARLQRKTTNLRDIVRTNRVGTERSSVSRLEADVLRLELQLEGLSGIFLKVSFFLLIASVVGVGWVSLMSEYAIGCIETIVFVGFYLALPFLAFLGASWVIRRKCSLVDAQVATARKRILEKL